MSIARTPRRVRRRRGRTTLAAVTLVVLLPLGALAACAGDVLGAAAAPGGERTAEGRGHSEDHRAGGRDRRDGTGRTDAAADADADDREPPTSTASGTTNGPRLRLITRVVDGDTVELAGGQDVRLVGIDTPERGECGYDVATAALRRLVEGREVRLTRPGEDRDHYGRLLRYLDVGDVDPGLRLIRRGLAIARYDSRDGYGYHPRQPSYVRADRGTPARGCLGGAASPQPRYAAPTPARAGCATGYSPCVPPYPPDVDCGDLGGAVRVAGSDPHGLDGDGDGRACEG